MSGVGTLLKDSVFFGQVTSDEPPPQFVHKQNQIGQRDKTRETEAERNGGFKSWLQNEPQFLIRNVGEGGD